MGLVGLCGALTVNAAARAEHPGRLRAIGTLLTECNAGVSNDVTQTRAARFATVHTTIGVPRHRGRVRCAGPGSQRRGWERFGRRRPDESLAREIQ